MIPIVCIEENNGILFNKRRVSRDEVLCERIMELTKGSTLWMQEFSRKLFLNQEVKIDENFLELAEEQDYCFVEKEQLAPHLNRISKVIVCKWNRRYPSDFKLDLDFSDGMWTGKVIDEFSGKSHEKITIEEWSKK